MSQNLPSEVRNVGITWAKINSALASTKVKEGVRVEAKAVAAYCKSIAPVDDSGRGQHLTDDVEVEAVPIGTPSRSSTAPTKTARRMRASART